MKYSEIKKMSLDDLNTALLSIKAELSNLKFMNSVSPIENPMLIRRKRKNIAKLKTALSACKV
jgi:large subunit ribosomal protein L29